LPTLNVLWNMHFFNLLYVAFNCYCKVLLKREKSEGP
jgi:hypothetical protein